MEYPTKKIDFENMIPFKDSNVPIGKSKLTIEQSIALDKRLMPQIKEAVKLLKIEMREKGFN